MKQLKHLIILFFAACFFYACQKEVSLENGSSGTPSDGSLQGAGGNCLGNTVAGTYKKDTALTASNYVDVQINVNTPGTYLVYTDTVNGMYFRATGTFTIAGANTVRLMGTGKPLATGTNSFTVNYDSTQCNFSITTLGGTTGGTSAFTFVCGSSADSVTIGSTPTATDTVHMQVNVTTVGTWTITPAALQGVTYSGTGTFTTTGLQTIVLTASGTPTTPAGTVTYPVTYGTSSCSFPLTFVAGVVVPNGDYFPLTLNSWWSYDDPDMVFGVTDSLMRFNYGSFSIAGNSYSMFEERDNTDPFDTIPYRKATNGDYFERSPVDYYTAVSFEPVVVGDINFLKQTLATNQTWESAEFSGTAPGGMSLKLKYAYKCIDANASVTVNGRSFTNVYKITWRAKFNLSNIGYQDDPAVSWESWYAKGIGLIYTKVNDLQTGNSGIVPIRNWLVN